MKTGKQIQIVLRLAVLTALLLSFGCSAASSRVAVAEQNRPQAAREPFLAAAVEFNPVLNERDQNVEKLLVEVEKALQQGAKLVVTPEMATTGYQYTSREAIRPFVDTIPGRTTDRFAALAHHYHAYIAIGMAEVDPQTDIFYNSAALVGPDGYVGKYRKLHLWEAEEHWAAWGDLGVPVFNTELGRLAINICMDSAYYESARLAALGGADVLLFLTNSSAQTVAALPARAQQNGMYIVSANRSDTELNFHMAGLSAIWSPAGHKLAETPFSGKENKSVPETVIIKAKIDPAQYHNPNRAAVAGRRPELYQALMLKVAPWDYSKNNTSHEVTAAALQYAPVVGDKAANYAKIARLVAEAKAAHVDLKLVVLPELSATGPVDSLSGEQIQRLAESGQGETVAFMRELARKNGLNIVFGLVEEEQGHLYDSTLLVGADGTPVGKYRKTHLSQSDRRWATAGDALDVFTVADLGRVGLLIGDDVRYPEAAGVLTVKRADIICIPSAWHGQYSGTMEINPKVSGNPYPEGSVVLWDAVAMASEAYTVVANYVGTEAGYAGRSSLFTIDPIYQLDQPVVASGDKEQSLVVKFKTLQSDWWINQNEIILSRRTDAYKPLVVEQAGRSGLQRLAGLQ